MYSTNKMSEHIHSNCITLPLASNKLIFYTLFFILCGVIILIYFVALKSMQIEKLYIYIGTFFTKFHTHLDFCFIHIFLHNLFSLN